MSNLYSVPFLGVNNHGETFTGTGNNVSKVQYYQPWLDFNNPCYIGPGDRYNPSGPGETFAGNYALKVQHYQQNFAPRPTPNFCDYLAGTQNDSIFRP